MQLKTVDRNFILTMTALMEGALLLVSTIWITNARIDLAPHLVLSRKAVLVGAVAGCCMAASGFIATWLGKKLKLARPGLLDLDDIMRNHLAPLFRQFTPLDILLVAAASGFCEEVFFRGVLQNQVNIFFAGIIFGVFHCPDFRYLIYGLWATVAGIFLGWLYLCTGSLWAPIFAHGLSNLIVIAIFRYWIAPGNKAKSD